MIGIIGAMDVEVNGLVEKMTINEESVISSIKYYKGTIHEKNVVIAKCNPGKVNAAICAQTMILKFSPDVIINSGVAGGLNKDLGICDVAIATDVVEHDMDTSPLGDPKGLISGINVVNFDTDSGVSDIMEKSIKHLGINTVRGIIASGDQFIANAQRKKEIAAEFDAIACEMEGASIGQVCYVNKVPFAVMRTISDGKGEALDYMTFSKIAANRSIDIIKKFLMNA